MKQLNTKLLRRYFKSKEGEELSLYIDGFIRKGGEKIPLYTNPCDISKEKGIEQLTAMVLGAEVNGAEKVIISCSQDVMHISIKDIFI